MEYCFSDNYNHVHVFNAFIFGIWLGIVTKMVGCSTRTSRRRHITFNIITDPIIWHVQKHVNEASDTRFLMKKLNAHYNPQCVYEIHFIQIQFFF